MSASKSNVTDAPDRFSAYVVSPMPDLLVAVTDIEPFKHAIRCGDMYYVVGRVVLDGTQACIACQDGTLVIMDRNDCAIVRLMFEDDDDSTPVRPTSTPTVGLESAHSSWSVGLPGSSCMCEIA